MFGRKKRSASPTGLKEHKVDLFQYRRFLQQLTVEVATERTTILKYVGCPDGTFALNATSAATGQQDLHHFELEEQGAAVCPHCIIWFSLNELSAHRQLDFDMALVEKARNTYTTTLRKALLPELYIMHSSTLQGPGGRLLGQNPTADWATDCNAVAPPEGVMPFTGDCPKHAYNGR